MIRATLLLLLLPLLVLGSLDTFAHDGDPKALDLQPPYVGPGYRAAFAALGPPAFGFPSSNMTLYAWLPLAEIGDGTTLDNGNDCWGYVSASGREYAIIGSSHGTTFVEVTNPGNPTVIDLVPGNVSLWRDIKTYQQYAYSVSEGAGGVQVIDMSDIDNGNVSLTATVDDFGTGKSHNVAIDETSGFLYRCGGNSNGLRIYDLSDPATPVLAGSWSDRYVHDASIVTYPAGTAYAGQQIAFCCAGLNGGWDETGLTILDVTDKSNIVELYHLQYADAAYSHQCWPSEDLQYIYLNDELDEQTFGLDTNTRVIDIADLANPSVVSTFSSGSTAIDHNLYVEDGLIFQANYRSGLRVFDASADPTNPTEIGYFDTYPPNDNPNFNGLWSVYPFLPSGTIIGSDIEKGLFVWVLGEPALALEFPLGQPDVLEPEGGDTITVEIVELTSDPLLPDSVTLHYSTGSGYTELTMTEVGGSWFEATLPVLPCGEVLEYYITAQSFGGYSLAEPWTSPADTFVASIAAFSTAGATQDFEAGASTWSVGSAADSATTGAWVLGDPIGTAAQPEDDHTAVGEECWFTGQGTSGGTLGEADVDDGRTTLNSPVFDLSDTAGAVIEVWYWYSNDQGSAIDDTFSVEISDNGTDWVIAHAQSTATSGWERLVVHVNAHVSPTSTVQLRFVATDDGAGSIVEAAIDDVTVYELSCTDCNGNGIDDSLEILGGLASDCNANGIPDDCDLAAGTSIDLDGDLVPDECQCPVFFIRGDTNNDENVDVSDAVYALDFMFDAGPDPMPLESADVNDDGSVNIADAVYLLAYLFTLGAEPVAPFPDPGCP